MCSETRQVVQKPQDALRLKVEMSRVLLALSQAAPTSRPVIFWGSNYAANSSNEVHEKENFKIEWSGNQKPEDSRKALMDKQGNGLIWVDDILKDSHELLANLSLAWCCRGMNLKDWK